MGWVTHHLPDRCLIIGQDLHDVHLGLDIRDMHNDKQDHDALDGELAGVIARLANIRMLAAYMSAAELRAQLGYEIEQLEKHCRAHGS